MKIPALTLFVCLLLLPVTGCDTWDEKININPNHPRGIDETGEGDVDVDPSAYMIPMLHGTIGDHGYSYIQWNVIPAVCAYHGKTISLSQGNRHQSWHAFDDAGLWSYLYNSIRYVRNLRNAAISADDHRYKAIADIWESWTFSVITNLYGNVPYFGPISDDPPLQAKYDKQSEIYPALLEKLKLAGESLDRNDAPVDAGTDLVFLGNIMKWKKFSNMLRLRLAMYMSMTAPDEAVAIISEIVDNPETYPLMQSNDDNALYHTDEVYRLSVFYRLAKSKIEEAPFSNVFIELLIHLNDPRLPVIARPVQRVHTNPETHVLPSNPGPVKYAGHIYGITTDNAHSIQWNGGFPYASALGEFFRKEDAAGIPLRESASTPYLLATYSEQEFFLAEAVEKGMIPGIAEKHYNNAIMASMGYYGSNFASQRYIDAFGDQSLNNIEAYLDQPSVAYDGGREKLTLIAEQKWIASLFLGFEPYFDHRRTMLPQIRASSGADNFAQAGSGTKFPSRAAYSDAERANNPANVADAEANGYDIPIVDAATRNLARMWIIRDADLQMPIFQEPSYPNDYPVIPGVSGSGSTFRNWYDEHWNAMFWWMND